MGVEILLIAVIIAISCALLGVFLVLRQMSMMTDAISHTILLGIVVGFLITGDLNSPILIIAAVIMGVLTVFLTEMLVRTNRVKADAATGVVFPLLFAAAIIIISLSTYNVHLDIDAVLLGKLEMASINQLMMFGVNIGPKSLYIGVIVLLINVIFILVFFKELKIVSFNSAFAATLGIAPLVIHYLLMGLVSLTAVTAFSSVGSILVIALMVGPPITALQVTKGLKSTLFISVGVAIFNSVVGYFMAIFLDVTIAGVIATTTMVTFLVTLFFGPKKGIFTTIYRRQKQKEEFKFTILLMHIYNHMEMSDAKEELGIDGIHNHLNWTSKTLMRKINYGTKNELIALENEIFVLTKKGIEYHRNSILEFRMER